MNFYNRVKFTTPTTGTGDITADSALPGYRTPAQAGIPNGTTFPYLLIEGVNWETGIGTYTASGATIARSVRESSNSNNPISLAGNAIMMIATLAEEMSGQGILVQRVGTQRGDSEEGTTPLPYDDSIPQSSEGDQFLSQAITPQNAGNTLYIDIVIFGSVSTNDYMCVALFKDSVNDALAAVAEYVDIGTASRTIHLKHKMTAGTTSEIVFKVKVGKGSSGTFRLNGRTSTGRIFGGVAVSAITIDEVKE